MRIGEPKILKLHKVHKILSILRTKEPQTQCVFLNRLFQYPLCDISLTAFNLKSTEYLLFPIKNAPKKCLTFGAVKCFRLRRFRKLHKEIV